MLITEVGYFLLLAGLVLATLLAVLPTLGVISGQVQWQRLAPSLALAGFLALLGSFLALMVGFYYNDFSLVYVAAHANSLLPWYYKLSATWGGHEGSLLLWVMVLALWTAAVALFGRALPLTMLAKVLAVLGMVQTMMLAMLVFTSSPFVRTLPMLPVDGADLNPLLQDPGLIFHPPMLYMGYVGMAVPFAFCMAALWEGRLDAVWTRWLRPWALAAWGFLTLGIALGSWWAYYELGWGGFWFWDPVENASLMPWLAATALVHSLAVTELRGVFKAWTIMLAIIAFALSLLGTFLVRSGVITSVHSFAADPTRGLAVLLILGLVIGAGFLLFAWRGWTLTVESRYCLKSRESLLVVNNVLLLIAALVVLLGTLYPLIADAFALGQVSVGAPYFNTLLVPLCWILLLSLGIGASLRYKNDTRPLLRPALGVGVASVLLGAVATAAMTGLTQGLRWSWVIWISTSLSCWVLGFMLLDIRDKTKHASGKAKWGKLGRSYLGMQVAHVGVVLMVLGIAGVSQLSAERDVAMQKNSRIAVQGYDFVLRDLQRIKAANYDAVQASINISRNGKALGMLYPQKRHYIVTMMPMTEVGLQASLWQDIYVALGDPIDDDVWAVRVYIKPMVRFIWLGALVMALGGLLAMSDKRYRLARQARRLAKHFGAEKVLTQQHKLTTPQNATTIKTALSNPAKNS